MRDGIGSSFLEIIDFWMHWNRINCVRVFENCPGRNEAVPVLFFLVLFFCQLLKVRFTVLMKDFTCDEGAEK